MKKDKRSKESKNVNKKNTVNKRTKMRRTRTMRTRQSTRINGKKKKLRIPLPPKKGNYE